jgi:hypothetical protein
MLSLPAPPTPPAAVCWNTHWCRSIPSSLKTPPSAWNPASNGPYRLQLWPVRFSQPINAIVLLDEFVFAWLRQCGDDLCLGHDAIQHKAQVPSQSTHMKAALLRPGRGRASAGF